MLSKKNLWRHPYIPVWILLEHWNDDVSFVVFVCFTWQTYLVIFSILPDINICKLIMQVWKNMQNFHTKTENVFNLYLSNQPKFFVVRPNEKLHLFHPFNLFAATIFEPLPVKSLIFAVVYTFSIAWISNRTKILPSLLISSLS